LIYYPTPLLQDFQSCKILNTSLYSISHFETFHASFASGVKDNFTFFMAQGPDLSIYLFLITAFFFFFFFFFYLYQFGLNLGNHSNLFLWVVSDLSSGGTFLAWLIPMGCCAHPERTVSSRDCGLGLGVGLSSRWRCRSQTKGCFVGGFT